MKVKKAVSGGGPILEPMTTYRCTYKPHVIHVNV